MFSISARVREPPCLLNYAFIIHAHGNLSIRQITASYDFKVKRHILTAKAARNALVCKIALAFFGYWHTV